MTDEQITIGELHRTCERIETSLGEMRAEAKADRHALAGRIDAHGVQLAIHDEQLKGVKAWKTWAGGVIGATLVGALDWLRK